MGWYQSVMQKGWYLGHHALTGAILVMTEQGVERGSGATRMPEESRWSMEKWQELKGYPWNVAQRERQTVPEALVSGADAEKIKLPTNPLKRAANQERRMYVSSADVEKYAPTDVCPGCTCITGGG